MLLMVPGIAITQDNYFTDPRDKEVYRTVTIGSQIWMAENLRYKTKESKVLKNKKNRYVIFYDHSYKTARTCGEKDQYGAQNISCKQLEKNGRYYEWEEANTVCPEGWHLPSEDEWKELFRVVSGDSEVKKSNNKVGRELKSVNWVDGDSGNDPSGFSAFGSGWATYRNIKDLGYKAIFWTSSNEIIGSKVIKGYHLNVTIARYNDKAEIDGGMDGYGKSVRCIKD